MREEELKEEWVQLLQNYTGKSPATANGHLPRYVGLYVLHGTIQWSSDGNLS